MPRSFINRIVQNFLARTSSTGTTLAVGDESVAFGSLLISLDGDTTILDADGDTSDDFDVMRHDIISLDISQTEMNGGTMYNSGFVLFAGLDVGLDDNSEAISGFSFLSKAPGNDARVLGNNQLTRDEGETVALDSSNLSASDLNDPDSSRIFTVANVIGGHLALSTDIVTPITSFSTAQLDAGDIVFVDDGDETVPAYDVEVSDGSLTDGIEAGTINFTNVNDAVVSLSGVSVGYCGRQSRNKSSNNQTGSDGRDPITSFQTTVSKY